ncbi:hypothetical protein KHQ81_15815 (plasmid) [Mycoplasmatota bacterium]|nr:hypothetical protein KHQ81_15815 [Mycoplasmatota bacterium]
MLDNRSKQYAVEIPEILKEKNYALMEKILKYNKDLANSRFEKYKKEKDLARYPLREAILNDDEKMVDLLLKYDVNIHVQDSIIIYDLIEPNNFKYFNKLKDIIDFNLLEPTKILDSLLNYYSLDDIIHDNIPDGLLALRDTYTQEILVKTLINNDLNTFNHLSKTVTPDLSYDNGKLMKLMVFYNLIDNVDKKILKEEHNSNSLSVLIQLAIRGENNKLAKELIHFSEEDLDFRKVSLLKFLRVSLACQNSEISSFLIKKGASLEDTHWGISGQQAIEVFGM